MGKKVNMFQRIGVYNEDQQNKVERENEGS